MSMLDGRGFVPADFDRDGDVDFFITNNNQAYDYLENRTGETRSWLTVQLRGTTDNSFGIGAKVRITTASEDGGAPRVQTRQIHIGSGYLSSPPAEANFGLADAEIVDRLEVLWPNGSSQVFENIEARNVVVVDQEAGLRVWSDQGGHEREGAEANADPTATDSELPPGSK